MGRKRKEQDCGKYLSEQLRALIYNPDIPPAWINLPKTQGLRVFHCLFFTLHEDFQRKAGNEFAELVSEFKRRKVKHFEVSSPRNCWKRLEMKRLKVGDTVGGETDNLPLVPFEIEGCPKRGDCVGCSYGLPEYVQPIGPYELYIVLTRGDIAVLGKTSGSNVSGIRDAYEPDTDIEKVSQVKLLRDKKYRERLERAREDALRDFSGYYTIRQLGYMPKDIYCKIDISRPEEELKRDVEAFIKEKRNIYFQEHPFEKHVKKKRDYRTQSYDLGVLADHFRAHVLHCHNTSYKEIAEKVYPGQEGKPIGRILTEARRYIRNAWRGDFPGNVKA